MIFSGVGACDADSDRIKINGMNRFEAKFGGGDREIPEPVPHI